MAMASAWREQCAEDRKTLEKWAFAGTGPVRSQVIVGGVVQGGDRHPQHSAENF